MADKKISQLTALGAADLDPASDLILILDNGSIPISKTITPLNLMTGAKASATSATQVGETNVLAFRSNVTVNVVFTQATTVRGADIVVRATTGATNTAYQYALTLTSGLANVSSNVTTEHAVAKLTLDLANSAVPMVTNTHGLIIEVANTGGVRTVNAQSFVAFGDLGSNSTTAQTLYLFDIGKNGAANVSANVGNGGASNTTVMFANASAGVVATHRLRVRVAGQDYWLLLANSSNI